MVILATGIRRFTIQDRAEKIQKEIDLLNWQKSLTPAQTQRLSHLQSLRDRIGARMERNGMF